MKEKYKEFLMVMGLGAGIGCVMVWVLIIVGSWLMGQTVAHLELNYFGEQVFEVVMMCVVLALQIYALYYIGHRKIVKEVVE